MAISSPCLGGAARRAALAAACAALALGCGGGGSDRPEPYAAAVTFQWWDAGAGIGARRVELRVYADPGCALGAVAVEGPGLDGPAALACQGDHWALDVADPPESAATSAYTFSGGGRTFTSAAGCWLAPPAPIDPAHLSTVEVAAAPAEVTVRWTDLAGSLGAPVTYRYRAGLFGMAPASTAEPQAILRIGIEPGEAVALRWDVEAATPRAHDPGAALRCGSSLTGWRFFLARPADPGS